MNSFWMMMNSHLAWTWKTTSLTEYLWVIIGLLATGWYLSTMRRA